MPDGAPARNMDAMKSEKAGPSIRLRLIALVVLLIGAWILLKVVIGIVAGLAWFIVIIGALLAVLWAWSTLRR